MELDELHVADAATGAPGGSDAVAGGGVGIGRVQIDLARAAGGQNGVCRAEGEHVATLHIQRISAVALVAGALELAVGDQVNQHVVLEHRDVGRAPQLGNQRALHGRAGGVGGMHDAALAVAAFTSQVQLAGLVAVF